MALTLPRFDDARVLVCGDVMLDRYLSGPVTRISPEAPVPIVRVEDEDFRPGGAANVALGVAALGARCTLAGLVGDDEAADALEARLVAAGVDCALVRVPGWRTITKLRVLSRRQQLLRLDFEVALPAEAAADAAAALHAAVARAAATHAVVVFSDYDKGALAEPQALVAAAAAAGARVLVDPKAGPYERWRGADLLKPNLAEFEAVSGRASGEADLLARAEALRLRCGVGALLVTRGEAGMTLVRADAEPLHLPARAVEVFDVTGAGDTVMAALAAMVAAGDALDGAARIANVAAGVAVSHTGTVSVSAPELRGALQDERAPDRGLLDQDQLAAAVARARRRGERIVFTNGCFDIVHAGHVAYLEQARALGDRMIVAINGDASVRRLKGPGRPVNRAEHRARVLAGLAAVDWVTVFDEDTPETLLDRLAPDVLVKGGDYRVEEVVGADLVRAQGGEVRVLDFHDALSTSAIVERLQAKAPGSGD
ncbi:MAG TPA: bifunctional D-glycero-beta-D-manno-heptose-7-phosphate kinase/D-glycero-beta-D-manno-heptose 1-phosphate adenylyltransferase HldE [Pseudomonadales bacterium]|nr:bifunctional D-glycero-beta-D-manno-heptose-7-phosphate kinase/D-glycero-beta-D-manno-heptose 1-phosphate adenylyltransferase HldE [Pseudomonadales bacterium]